VADIPDTFNSILYATVQPTQAGNLDANLALLGPDAHPLLRDAGARVAANLQPTPHTSVVFTDDLAPVEQLTNSIVIRFILSAACTSLTCSSRVL
jgi:hypothetical protein